MTAVVFLFVRSQDYCIASSCTCSFFMDRVEEKLSESTCQNPKLIRGMLEFCLSQKRLGMSGGWCR